MLSGFFSLFVTDNFCVELSSFWFFLPMWPPKAQPTAKYYPRGQPTYSRLRRCRIRTRDHGTSVWSAITETPHLRYNFHVAIFCWFFNITLCYHFFLFFTFDIKSYSIFFRGCGGKIRLNNIPGILSFPWYPPPRPPTPPTFHSALPLPVIFHI